MGAIIAAIFAVGGLASFLFGCAEPRHAPGGRVAREPPADAVPNETALHVSVNEYPVVYDDPDEFALDVFFENRGDHPLIILPSLIHRQYSPMDEAGTVTYVPLTGPKPSPWEGAFTLAPQETKVVTLVGMRDWDGLWRLGRGFYRMSIRYVVDEDVAVGGAGRPRMPGGRRATVWIGEKGSRDMTVRYEPGTQGEGEPAAGGPALLDERRAGDAAF